MLTRKLFVIAILGMLVAFSSAAFGQNTTKKKLPKAKPKATATTNSSQRNSPGTNTPGTPTGTPKPYIGDVLDGVGIRSTNPNQPTGTPKPVIGDTLDGVGIKSNGGGQGQTPPNLRNPNTLPNGTVQNVVTNNRPADDAARTTANPPGGGQTTNLLPYMEQSNLKKPNAPSQTTVTGQNAASPKTVPASPKPKKKTKGKH